MWRAAGAAAKLAEIDPGLIAAVQLYDAKLELPDGEEYKRQLEERLVPGEGELTLVDMIRCVPDGRVITGEVTHAIRARR